jgi:hypothetical protein
MCTEWWLRPVSSAARVGEHRAVVWNWLYRSPRPATRSSAASAPPHRTRARSEAHVVEQDHHDVGAIFGAVGAVSCACALSEISRSARPRTVVWREAAPAHDRSPATSKQAAFARRSLPSICTVPDFDRAHRADDTSTQVLTSQVIVASTSAPPVGQAIERGGGDRCDRCR